MKLQPLTLSALLLSSSFAFSASGIFGTGTVLTNNGTLTLYQTNLLGDSRHEPAGLSPAQNSVGLGGLDLGDFDPASGDSLTIGGGGLLTYKNGLSDIFGTTIFYSVNGGTETSVGLLFNEDNVNGSAGDQRWYSEGSTADLLAGLANGDHTLTVRYEAGSSDGIHPFGPFTADFTVIPEPSAALLGGLGLLSLLRRRRA
ncbi:MAG: hypothetical protein ACSHYB_17405 [Roseibacillus sp.]